MISVGGALPAADSPPEGKAGNCERASVLNGMIALTSAVEGNVLYEGSVLPRAFKVEASLSDNVPRQGSAQKMSELMKLDDPALLPMSYVVALSVGMLELDAEENAAPPTDR